MQFEVVKLDEPLLAFGHGQSVEDPRDGLTLFGPLDAGKPYGIRAGVVGTRRGIDKLKDWIQSIQSPVGLRTPMRSRPPFLGFEATFGIPWAPSPVCEIEIDEQILKAKSCLSDRHQRVFQTVHLYCDEIIESLRTEEIKPDIWFVVVPDYVRASCRPQGTVDPSDRQSSRKLFGSAASARDFADSNVLFPELQNDAYPYLFQEHFRNQLKATLLNSRISSQVVVESTLDGIDSDIADEYRQATRKLQSAIAWNLSTAAYYKVGGRPWKVDGIRKGVCYVGLVYKRIEHSQERRAACCGAQMFLDSGDGVVFKGAVGPWYSELSRSFHLDYEAAFSIAKLALSSYAQYTGDTLPPRELFIHGKTRFHCDEWQGFSDAVSTETKVVGVSIRDDPSFKLFTTTDTPVLRGLAVLKDKDCGWLWTRGWVPRLGTYPGLEVPNPLRVEVCQGYCDLACVMRDILALTKLNYNSCQFADGLPITLKFASAIGEVLTVGPVGANEPPLPFMYYI